VAVSGVISAFWRGRGDGCKQRTVDALKAGAPTVKRWGGRILLAVGVWFIALGVFSSFFADVFPV
jgi:hypothetical protein